MEPLLLIEPSLNRRMILAPIPDDDAERLSALRDLLILDTPPEERFDRIVQFAASEFDVPMALLSLVDENRQWFKSRFGLPFCEGPRKTSFCGHAVAAREFLVVPDTLQDLRFVDNPMVVGAPFVRSYAGAPLILAGGHCVGVLCLLDTRARDFDRLDLAILATLRDLVLKEMEAQGAPPASA
jgi:GAF domain-containing protein